MEKKKNIPTLRFPEFTGEWEEKKLGEIAEIIMGQSPAGDSYNTEGIGTPLINGPAEFTDKYPVKIKWTTEAKRCCQKHDILFCVRGSTTGRMNISNDNYCIGRGVAAIRENFNSKTSFIEFALIKNINTLLSLTSGSTFQNIDSKTLNDFLLYHPIIKEQTKIASFLTAVDEKITQLKKKKTLLEQYKKGVMQQLFSQELRFKDDNNNDFPDWKEKQLGKIGTFFSGGTPLTTRKEYYEGNIPFIRSGEISLDKTELYISELGLINSSAKMVEVGDLIYALYGATSGEVAISKIRGAINQAILCIRTNMINQFLCNYFKLKKEIILNTYLQGGQGNLSADIIKSLIIPIPSLPEQQKIANFLSSIDEKISQCGAKIEKMETWKKGLLQQMFC